MTDHIDLNAIEDLEPEPMSEGDANLTDRKSVV